MRVLARMLSAEAICTRIFSSSMSFIERQARCETLPMTLEEKIQDYLESGMRVGLHSLRPISSNFPSSARTLLSLGNIALFHPIPTLGMRALLSTNEGRAEAMNIEHNAFQPKQPKPQ